MPERYLPIEEHGVIGDLRTTALVGTDGTIDWYCPGRFDAPSLFASLLDADRGGFFRLAAQKGGRPKQLYMPDTNILLTRFLGREAVGEVIDFMVPETSSVAAPRDLLVRRARAVRGRAEFVLDCTPAFDYGRARHQVRLVDGVGAVFTSSAGRFVLRVQPGVALRLTDGVDGGSGGPGVTAEFALEHGEQADVVLEWRGDVRPLVDGEVDEMFDRTSDYWQRWSAGSRYRGRWREVVQRSALTLKLLVYHPTGALVAAPTTSLPEDFGGERNWDYRYCWLRDAFFVVRALNSLSEVGTMEDYLRWLSNVVVASGGEHVQPLYGIGFEKELPESFVEHLGGYRGMGPVRVGNQAQEHFQHDVYGNIVLGAAQAFHDHRLLHRAGRAEFAQLEKVGEQAIRVYGTPDAGMWELRTRARIHTSSALMSWAACDRLAKIARALGLAERAAYWHDHARRMQAEILEKSWNPDRRAFAESFGGRDLDASVLLMAEVGFIDPRDERFVATVDALEKYLCDCPYMRRYEAPDDFGKPETAFNICTFWRIDALARIGRKDEARAIFETMLAARNHVGMLSEDTHPVTGEMWGNFPQTYSMVGIINAAVRLSEPWDTAI